MRPSDGWDILDRSLSSLWNIPIVSGQHLDRQWNGLSASITQAESERRLMEAVKTHYQFEETLNVGDHGN
ncbi:hypothetical protein JZ751_015531 [Albula glossodonta]|uniref:Uncharacterized protein n=1 Tax=Albula glossodonta TaxID=121402 RepID=A0A8T2MYG2_9TELE|nr:hypothetical protein JZ751_015531 [Albula glossodonta]